MAGQQLVVLVHGRKRSIVGGQLGTQTSLGQRPHRLPARRFRRFGPGLGARVVRHFVVFARFQGDCVGSERSSVQRGGEAGDDLVVAQMPVQHEHFD